MSTSVKHPLVGKTFLSYTLKPNGYVVGWQGEIVAVMPSNSPVGDLALVQLADWIMGHNSNCHLIPLTALAAPANTGDLWFKLFNSDEERNTYYETWKHRDTEQPENDEPLKMKDY